MQQRFKKILIVGGGTAGWMTAAAFGRMLKNGGYQFELVESDEIGTVGVGEATIPPIVDYNRTMRIDEVEFIRATQASFKLAIEFVDWTRLGHSYIHPFGSYGVPMQNVYFHHFWLRHRAQGGTLSHDLFNSSTMGARAGRFARPAAPPLQATAERVLVVVAVSHDEPVYEIAADGLLVPSKRLVARWRRRVCTGGDHGHRCERHPG